MAFLSEINLHPDRRVLRQFAAAWLLFIGGMGVWKWIARGPSPAVYAMVTAGVVIGLLGLAAPAAIRLVYAGATLITFPIGWAISKFFLALLFFVVLAPIALGFRLLRRDRLRLKPPPGETCWIAREESGDAASYLRQF